MTSVTMVVMNAQQIRQQYLQFFSERGHAAIPRALLVPQNDPTTLFTGSGMQPLLPYLLGQEHPQGARLTDSQTCLRAQDIEEVLGVLPGPVVKGQGHGPGLVAGGDQLSVRDGSQLGARQTSQPGQRWASIQLVRR